MWWIAAVIVVIVLVAVVARQQRRRGGFMSVREAERRSSKGRDGGFTGMGPTPG
jgi:hypothetical protein